MNRNRYTCSLQLVRRLWPVVDGEHYDGEILRFRVHIEPEGDVPPPLTPDQVIELRIGGHLLAEHSWDALSVREIATHGMAFVRERLQRDGLPLHSPATLILNEQTDGGVFLKGSPYSGEAILPGRSFPVPASGQPADRLSLSN